MRRQFVIRCPRGCNLSVLFRQVCLRMGKSSVLVHVHHLLHAVAHVDPGAAGRLQDSYRELSCRECVVHRSAHNAVWWSQKLAVQGMPGYDMRTIWHLSLRFEGHSAPVRRDVPTLRSGYGARVLEWDSARNGTAAGQGPAVFRGSKSLQLDDARHFILSFASSPPLHFHGRHR